MGKKYNILKMLSAILFALFILVGCDKINTMNLDLPEEVSLVDDKLNLARLVLNEEAEFLITPKTGKKLDQLIINGVDQTSIVNNNRFVTKIVEGLTIEVTFKDINDSDSDKYTVTLGEGLSSNDTLTDLVANVTISILITVPEGQEVDEFKVDDNVINLFGATVYELTVTKNHNLTVTFKDRGESKYTVTLTEGLSSEDQLTDLKNGATVNIIITVPEGQEVNEFRVDGRLIDLNGALTYKLVVSSGHFVSVTFKDLPAPTYTITLDEGLGCMHSLTNLLAGTERYINISLPPGQEVDEFKVDGNLIDLNGALSYKLTVTKDHHVTITFKDIPITTYQVTLDEGLSSDDALTDLIVGATVTIKIDIPEGKEINELKVDDAIVNLNGTLTYTLIVSDNHNVTVSFKDLPLPKYNVTWKNGSLVLEFDYYIPHGTNPEYNSPKPTKEADAQYTYTFSGWSPELSPVTSDITYEAQFTKTLRTYTITWKNGEEVLKTDLNVLYGDTPEYNGIKPTLLPTSQYTYTFAGWDPEVSEVTGDATYQASFSKELRTYTITWKNGEKVLETDLNVSYGTTPEYNGTTPTLPSTNQYNYKFAGWDPEVSEVTGDATYQASFSKELRKYTITWKNGEEVLETDLNVLYGATPEYNGIKPTLLPTSQYTYTFADWSPEVSEVTGDATYQATFSKATRTHTVIWKNGDSVLQTDENLLYGATPKYNGTPPTRPITAQHTYTFIGWSPAVGAVTSDVIYTADFSVEINKYTITWKNHDGTVLKTDTNILYGTTATYTGQEPTKSGGFVFAGWSPTVGKVIGNIEYTAQFTEPSTTDKYTITWKNYDGTILERDTNVLTGETPTYDGATPTKTADAQYMYVFNGWYPEVSAVTEDVIYVALFREVPQRYTITWKNYNGEILKEERMGYGDTPYYGPNNPTRPATAQYTYTFIGWSPEITSVIEDVLYIAEFSETVNKYTITWKNGEEILETDYNILYGETPEYNGIEPTLLPTSQYTYTFAGWSPEISVVERNQVYIAQFTKTLRTYTITWKNGIEVLETDLNVPYGTIPEYNGTTPTIPSTPLYTYTFAGWDPEVSEVIEDQIYQAYFTKEAR